MEVTLIIGGMSSGCCARSRCLGEREGSARPCCELSPAAWPCSWLSFAHAGGTDLCRSCSATNWWGSQFASMPFLQTSRGQRLSRASATYCMPWLTQCQMYMAIVHVQTKHYTSPNPTNMPAQHHCHIITTCHMPSRAITACQMLKPHIASLQLIPGALKQLESLNNT